MSDMHGKLAGRLPECKRLARCRSEFTFAKPAAMGAAMSTLPIKSISPKPTRTGGAVWLMRAGHR